MALYYPPLKWPTTEKIWRNLIRRALEPPMKVECNSEHLITFAYQLFEKQGTGKDPTHWNGRQIRNAFQSAIALARNESFGSDKNVLVKPSHFKTVAEVSEEFNDYILRVKGQTYADKAKESQNRDDSFTRATYTQGPSPSQQHQYPPPAQAAQMPMMRQAAPSATQYQSFPVQQFVPQQAVYPTTTGSPYNPNQQFFYANPQPPPQSNFPHAYNTQQSPQPAYNQNMQGSAAQQQQPVPNSPGQQFQSPQAQAHAGHSQQSQMGTQMGYVTGGAIDPTVRSPQGVQPSDPRVWQQ
jgi:hypothetical protein